MTHPRNTEMVGLIDALAERYLVGKREPLRLAVIALLAGGHVLLEDRPGLGKTTLALALARSLGLSFGRVQCTSDLLPSDVTGLSIFHREENRFRFLPGPVFNSVLLVDELNRAMPRTQSALLEAMEEMSVTVEGTTYPLPEPFLVIATQNPAEQVGTFPLPESQLDRFMIVTDIGYPPAELEKSIIAGGSIRDDLRRIEPLLSAEQLLRMRAAIREQVRLSTRLVEYIYQLVAASRQHPQIATGISTRGAIALAESSRVAAWLAGRDHVIPEDVQGLIGPVGAHRLILRPEHETVSKREVLSSIVKSLPVPRI